MMSDIPFLDLGRLHRAIRPDIDRAVARVVDSSAFINSSVVEAFEAEFATAHARSFAVGCGSGTDALTLALIVAGVGPGDEVIVPAMTFVATAEAVVHAGATPVIADVDEETLLLGPTQVASARTDACRAVIPVHLYGHVVDTDLLRNWVDDGLVVIEDAAQAHLASCRGRTVGAAGTLTCFSFYPGKNLGAFGDGGCVLTDDPGTARRLQRLRDHGSESKYVHEDVGYCSRLDSIQAAVLLAKLSYLHEWTEARRRLAARYRERLPDGMLVPWNDGAVHHLLVMRCANRDHLVDELSRRGIGSGIHYPRSLTQHAALARWVRGRCPAAEAAAGEVVSLPMDPLMTEAEVDRVCDVVMDVLRGDDQPEPG